MRGSLLGGGVGGGPGGTPLPGPGVGGRTGRPGVAGSTVGASVLTCLGVPGSAAAGRAGVGGGVKSVVASEGFASAVPHSGQKRAASGTAARQVGQVIARRARLSGRAGE